MNLKTALFLIECLAFAIFIAGRPVEGAQPKQGPPVAVQRLQEAEPGDDPAGDDGPFPAILPPVAPAPPDQPPPVPLLTPDKLYVVHSDRPFKLRVSLAGMVKIEYDRGPQTVHAVFVGGTETFERRPYPDKYLAFVSPIATEGRAELFFVQQSDEPVAPEADPPDPTVEPDIGVTILSQLVDCGKAPRPPPDEPDPPIVDPTPLPDGLEKVSYEAKLKVVSPTRPAEAKQLADAHFAAAKYAGQSPYRLVAEIQKEAQKSGLDAAAKLRWKVWGEAIKAATDKLQADGKLVGRLQWQQALTEIGNGLMRGENP